MNSINNSDYSRYLDAKYEKPISYKESKDELVNELTASSSRSSNITITISNEAQELLAKEQKDLGKTLAQQMSPKNNKETEIDPPSDTERLDKMIEDIQEQIKETQRNITALNGDKSEQAEIERKALDAQLVSLNATLIALMGKKMDEVVPAA